VFIISLQVRFGFFINFCSTLDLMPAAQSFRRCIFSTLHNSAESSGEIYTYLFVRHT